MKNRTLLIVFVGLLVIYAGSKIFSKKGQRSFDPVFLQVDTARIDRIVLTPKSAGGEDIVLTRVDSKWQVSKGDLTRTATGSSVEGLKNNLARIVAERIVSKDPDKFPDYEVDETSGSRVRAYDGDRLLADFISGRFYFNQQTRGGLSYVRKVDENDVYAIDGFLSMTFNQNFDSYRDRTILRVEPADLVELVFEDISGQTDTFRKTGNTWIKNETPLDSAHVAGILNGYRFVSSSDFADDFSPDRQEPVRELTIRANNLQEPVNIRMYQVDTTFYIHSSQNPENIFSSDRDGIADKLFFAMENADRPE
jgi:hypothetical protein